MTVDLQCMNAEEIALSLQSAQLEQLYQQALSQAERIYEEERARSLRVQLLLLEDENDELREQMDNDEDSMHKLENVNEELRDQLVDAESQYQAVQMELKAQLRDLERCKTEITALNAARTNSNALLSEKLALSRELEVLKPEVEHLKSQASAHQSILSQKLALEREFSAIQVELENEKRTVQRLKTKDKNINSADTALAEEVEELKKELTKERRVAKEAAFKDAARVEHIEELELELARAKRNVEKSSSNTALSQEIEDLKEELDKEKKKNSKSKSNDIALSSEVDDLKKELAKAKRDLQKMERENLKKATEWDSQKEVLEEKLEAFRTKLRTTKDQLKEAQDELEKAEQSKFAAITEASKARLAGANPRKRNVARFDPDMTIGTPGHGGPAKKQRISVNASDKSNFSITPFLNRTMSILPESPEDQAEQKKSEETLPEQSKAPVPEIQEEAPVVKETAAKKVKVTKGATMTTSKSKTARPLQESTNPKANTAVKKTALPKVVEEDNEEADGQQENKAKDVESNAAKKPTINKRPTIFDDDEDAAPKKTKKLNLGGLKAGGLGLGKINLTSKNKVLAEFSPLKKDRKALVM